MAYTVNDRGVRRPLSDVLSELSPEELAEYKDDIRAVLEADGQKPGADFDALFSPQPAASAPALEAPAAAVPEQSGFWEKLTRPGMGLYSKQMVQDLNDLPQQILEDSADRYAASNNPLSKAFHAGVGTVGSATAKFLPQMTSALSVAGEMAPVQRAVGALAGKAGSYIKGGAGAVGRGVEKLFPGTMEQAGKISDYAAHLPAAARRALSGDVGGLDDLSFAGSNVSDDLSSKLTASGGVKRAPAPVAPLPDPASEAAERLARRGAAPEPAPSPESPIGAKKKSGFESEDGSPGGAQGNDKESFKAGAGAAKPGAGSAAGGLNPSDSVAVDELLAGKHSMPARPATGLKAFFSNPVESVRRVAHWVEDQIDSSAKVLRSKVDEFKASELARLHLALRTHPSRVKDAFKHDAGFVFDSLSGLKSPEEGRLFNVIYSLKHYAHQYEVNGLNYGGASNFGGRAKALLAELRSRLTAAGKGDQLARVEAATEDFASRVDDVGLKSVDGLVDPEVFRGWQKKNRYYMFARTADHPVPQDGGSIPDMDEIFTRYLKRRKGFAGMPVLDPIELFSEYHFKRLLAQDKRRIIGDSIKKLGTIFGNSADLERALASRAGDVRYEAPAAYNLGDHITLPREIAEVFKGGDSMTSGVFYQAVQDFSSIFHKGALDLNPRFYASSVRRDVFDSLLRSRGYLTPIDKALGKAFGENAPDLEYLLNPALWWRAAKASVRENFGKGDALYDQIRATGAIQMPDVKTIAKEVMPSQLQSRGQRIAKAYVAPRLMKTMDDFWRIGQALRAVTDDARGLAGMGKMAKLGEDGAPVVFKNFDEHILNVRGTNIDFEMKSDFLRRLDVMSPFLSAMVQSPYQTWQFAKAQPFSMALRTAGFMSAAVGAYTALKGRPDDPLDRFSDYDKDRYIFADTGLRRGNRPIFAPIAVVPEPIQPAWEALRRMLDISAAKDPDFKKGLKDRFLAETASASLGSYVNLGGPVIASIEAPLNHSLYKGGKSIVSDRQRYDPTELQAAEGTQNIYRFISHALRGVPGNMAPDQYKHLARGFTGQISELAADAVDPLLKNAVPVPHIDVASGKFPFPVGDSSVLKRAPASPVEKITTALGLTRRGNSDPDRELAASTVGRVEEREKALTAELKHWQSIVILSKDKDQVAEANARIGDVVKRMVEELGPYGGVPAIREIMKNVSKDILYENNVPHGKVLQHLPRRYQGYFFRVLQNERPGKP